MSNLAALPTDAANIPVIDRWRYLKHAALERFSF